MAEEEIAAADAGPPKLAAVATTTGEEEEAEIWRNPATARAKLYRFDATTKIWKERGTGDVRFLKHQSTGKVRLVMRSGEGNRLLANHRPSGLLKPNGTKGTNFTWVAIGDVAEAAEAGGVSLMIRFATAEVAAEFQSQFDKAAQA
jgi:Ran-binding protein 1